MGTTKILLAVLVVLVGIFAYTNLGGQKSSPQNSGDGQQSQTSEVQSATTSNEFSERFISYSEENLKKASENGRAIVFFHAGWCPMCKAATEDLQANFDQVPKDVTILKTDYDTSIDLKAKYEITMQDSWVQVDKDGNKIVLWNSGGEGVKALLANLQ